MQAEQLLFCLLTVAQVAALVELRSERLEKDLEKEILHNTVQFIKTKWTKCLRRHNERNGRTKRKTSMHISWMLNHQVKISVLENTKSFLVNQLLNCRSSLTHHTNHNAQTEDDINEVHYDYDDRDQERLGEKVSKKIPHEEIAAVHPHYGVAGVRYDDSSVVGNLDSPRTVTLNGRLVSCGSLHSVHNKTALECLDLSVDHGFRLPNADLCPPTNKPNEWRGLNAIHKRTFKVLDLQNFCHNFGRTIGVEGFVSDVKVGWDCGKPQDRLKWLKGDWQGFVNDNGFLRDIQCFFNSEVDLR